MAENKQSLFRQKSIDTIESPESLNDYLKVTSPGVWILLLAIAFILCGVIIWGIFGRINTSCNVAVVSGNGESVCVVPYESVQGILNSGTVTVSGKEYALTGEISGLDVISEDTLPEIRIAGGFDIGDVYAVLPISASVEDGIVQGSVVTESLKPISLLLQ